MHKEAPRNKDQFIVTKKHLKAKVGEENECPSPKTKNSNLSTKRQVKRKRKREREREREREGGGGERRAARERKRLRIHHGSSQPLHWSERSLPGRMKFGSCTTPYAPLHAVARPKITRPVLSSYANGWIQLLTPTCSFVCCSCLTHFVTGSPKPTWSSYTVEVYCRGEFTMQSLPADRTSRMSRETGAPRKVGLWSSGLFVATCVGAKFQAAAKETVRMVGLGRTHTVSKSRVFSREMPIEAKCR